MEFAQIAGLLAGLAGFITAVIAYRKAGPETASIITEAAERAVNTTLIASDHQSQTLTEWITQLERKIEGLETAVEGKNEVIAAQDQVILELRQTIDDQAGLIRKQLALIERYENELDLLRGRVNHLEEWIRAQGFDPEALPPG